ncbi:MAG: hypothetical protein GXP41_03555 [Chloroflexi bacterium]|nr:hypothetical protein [Chloroflexota bacterium]
MTRRESNIRKSLSWGVLAAVGVALLLVAGRGFLPVGASSPAVAAARPLLLPATHVSPQSENPNGVIPTTQWVNFRSQNTTVYGTPIAIGAVVRAYDPGGTQCGEFPVKDHVGWYGLMACYADDPNTPIDEGATPGDMIHFTIDDMPAVVLGPDTPKWTQNAALMVVDLNVLSPTPTPVGTIPAPTASPQSTLYLPIIRR